MLTHTYTLTPNTHKRTHVTISRTNEMNMNTYKLPIISNGFTIRNFSFLGVQCKNRWRNIKDHYKRQRKLEKNPGTGSAAAVKKRASYWERLRFLDNVQDERESYSNTQTLPEQSITAQNLAEDIVDDPVSETDDNAREASSNDHPETSTPTNKRKQDASQSQNMSEVKNKRYRQDKELTSFLKKREEERNKYTKYLEKLTEPEPQVDEIDLFFKSVAATVKKFSPGLRTQAKLEIMQTVCKFECQNQTSVTASASESRSFSTFDYATSPASTASSVLYDYDSFGSFPQDGVNTGQYQ